MANKPEITTRSDGSDLLDGSNLSAGTEGLGQMTASEKHDMTWYPGGNSLNLLDDFNPSVPNPTIPHGTKRAAEDQLPVQQSAQPLFKPLPSAQPSTQQLFQPPAQLPPVQQPPAQQPPAQQPPAQQPPAQLPPVQQPPAQQPPAQLPPVQQPPAQQPPAQQPPAQQPPAQQPPAQQPPAQQQRDIEIKRIKKLIDYYSDSKNWSNEIDMWETDEAEFADENSDTDGEDSEEDEEEQEEHQRVFLHYSERRHLLEALFNSRSSARTVPLTSIVAPAIPKGVTLDMKELLRACHPDKFRGEEDKDLAGEVFKVYHEVIKNESRTVTGEHDDNLGLGFVDLLEPYHEGCYRRATQHLKFLYNEFAKGSDIQQKTGSIGACYKSIEKINNAIRKHNKRINNEEEFGTINLSHLISAWKVYRDCGDNCQAWTVCTQHHYPIGWGFVPPEENYEFDMDRSTSYQPLFAALTPRLMNYLDKFKNPRYSEDQMINDILSDQKIHEKEIQTLNAGMQRPLKLNIVDIADIVSHYYGAYTFKVQQRSDERRNVEEHLEKRIIARGWPLQWATKEPGTTATGTTATGTTAPGATAPGTTAPGTTAPGTTAPGTTAPGTTAPGTTAPGTTAPGTTAPGTTAPGTTAAGTFARFQGGVAIFSVPPHPPINCTITPGRTSSGDMILAMQKQGAGAALFAIKDKDGGYRVVPSGEAGGPRAITAAESVGVPWTVTSESNTNEIIEKYKQGNPLEIKYVACGPWDTTKFNTKGGPKMPYIIAGIQLPIGDFHVSRSRLGTILGSQKMADDKCREFLDNTQMSLVSSLVSRIDLNDHPQLLPFLEQESQKRLTYSGGRLQNPHYPLPHSSIQANQVGGYGQLPQANFGQPYNPQYAGPGNPQANFGQPYNPQYAGPENSLANFGQPYNPQYPGPGNSQASFGQPYNPQYAGPGNSLPNFGQPYNPQYAGPGISLANFGQPYNPQYAGPENSLANFGQPYNPQYPGPGNSQASFGQPYNPQYAGPGNSLPNFGQPYNPQFAGSGNSQASFGQPLQV